LHYLLAGCGVVIDLNKWLYSLFYHSQTPIFALKKTKLKTNKKLNEMVNLKMRGQRLKDQDKTLKVSKLLGFLKPKYTKIKPHTC